MGQDLVSAPEAVLGVAARRLYERVKPKKPNVEARPALGICLFFSHTTREACGSREERNITHSVHLS